MSRERFWASLRVAGFALLGAHVAVMAFAGFSRSGVTALNTFATLLGSLAVPLCTWDLVRRVDHALDGFAPGRTVGGALRVLLAVLLLGVVPGLFTTFDDAPLPLLGRVVELSTALLSIAVAMSLVFLGLGVADLLYDLTARFRHLSTRLMALLLFASLWTFFWLGTLGLSLRKLLAWAIEQGHLEAYVEGIEQLERVVDTYSGGILGGVAGVISLELPFTLLLAWRFGRNATRGLGELLRGFDRVAKGELESPVPVEGNDEVAEMQRGFNAMLEAARERRFLETAFGRYVSPVILERVKGAHEHGGLLQGERKDATVLFSDIRGFTAMSAELPPEQVISLLNAYMSRMIETIARYDGYINKFVGDAILVVFNAPIEQPDHALRALACAAAMQEELERANAARLFGERAFEMGIGINTGPVVAGNLGNARQVEFTVIGDTVNVASRACGIAGAREVAVTEAVLERAKSAAGSRASAELSARSLGAVELKGKGPTELFALETGTEPLDRLLKGAARALLPQASIPTPLATPPGGR